MGDLIADMPVILNARLETIAAGHAETAARLTDMDKQLAALTRDVRDMRGAVTRQLIAQDERLGAMEDRIQSMQTKFQSMDERFSSQLATILERLPPRP